MTYEYECRGCSHKWEVEQKITETALKDCPECKCAEAKRLISGRGAFVLKGQGWYADGYGSTSV